jgi:hypothetical protein
MSDLVLLVVRRAAIIRIDAAFRLTVRAAAAERLFFLGEALLSTTSAESCLPLFSRFASTMASSDFSSTYSACGLSPYGSTRFLCDAWSYGDLPQLVFTAQLQ